jgi:hypothetical protein
LPWEDVVVVVVEVGGVGELIPRGTSPSSMSGTVIRANGSSIIPIAICQLLL